MVKKKKVIARKAILSPKEIGDKLGVDWEKIRLNEFKKGLKVELEHKDVTKNDPIKTAKITLAHLKEMPDYYTRLAKMEKKK